MMNPLACQGDQPQSNRRRTTAGLGNRQQMAQQCKYIVAQRAQRKVQLVGAELSARQPVAGKVAFQLLRCDSPNARLAGCTNESPRCRSRCPDWWQSPGTHTRPARTYPSRHPISPQPRLGTTHAAQPVAQRIGSGQPLHPQHRQ